MSSARQQQQVLALTRQLDADLRDTQKVLAQELLGLRQQVKVRQTWVVVPSGNLPEIVGDWQPTQHLIRCTV